MKKTLGEIAAFLNGELKGDAGVLIENIRAIDDAREGDLTFIANPAYTGKLTTTTASGILVAPGTECPGKNLILVGDPYIALSRVLALYYTDEPDLPGIRKEAFLEEGAVISGDATIYSHATVCRGARIGAGVVLYPGVFVGRDAVIGDGTVLYPNVTVYHRCVIGKRVILHAGVVVGSDGFGFAAPGAMNIKIPQVGIVQIDDDVEVGANTTIDRATLGRTWIQRGVKIDNLVQVGHNVVIGENSVIVSQVGISGSTKLGKSVILGGQTGLAGHLMIGDHVMVAAQSGIHEDVPANLAVSGSPHLPHKDWLRAMSCVAKLPEMRKTLTSLAKRIEGLETTTKRSDKENR
ncbi:MAG: UDP-3-O-(3-hydroxymyristoyl)glucosamine N-acyltransferase [Deltaproteobacteria bacterium]|nr:UDP-3-O-(3-hydroxymyristoyl)glucosamine N-acyltransferase [Deltaproteobacteria bacterium]